VKNIFSNLKCQALHESELFMAKKYNPVEKKQRFGGKNGPFFGDIAFYPHNIL
jgi:hypothetical protein